MEILREGERYLKAKNLKEKNEAKYLEFPEGGGGGGGGGIKSKILGGRAVDISLTSCTLV